MSALAKELGISTKTLYAEFPSKAELVGAVVQRWIQRWQTVQREGIEKGLPPVARMNRSILLWIEMSETFSDECWSELRTHFPVANARVDEEFNAFFERAKLNLKDELRPELNADLALNALLQILQGIMSGRNYDRTKVTLLDALTQVITIWARGSIKPERLPGHLR